VYVRVRDTQRGSHEAPWNTDTVYIDYMCIDATSEDTLPPVISDVAATLDIDELGELAGATITWMTDEASTSAVSS
jgi:hypothetical protein